MYNYQLQPAMFQQNMFNQQQSIGFNSNSYTNNNICNNNNVGSSNNFFINPQSSIPSYPPVLSNLNDMFQKFNFSMMMMQMQNLLKQNEAKPVEEPSNENDETEQKPTSIITKTEEKTFGQKTWDAVGEIGGGAAKGAAVGALAGSVIPGLGTAVGAVAGGAVGGVVGLVKGIKGFFN